jgi:hypothetical protein
MCARAEQAGSRTHQRRLQCHDPNTPPRTSQKLIAAATLLRAMPAPSTPEARNLHRAAGALIEQAAVQQAECSASRKRQQGSAWDDGSAQGQEASVHAGGAAEQLADQGRTPVREHRSESGSLTRVGRPKTATPTGKAMQKQERQRAITLGRAVAMTAMRIAHRRWNPREPVCSARKSAWRAFPNASTNPPRSTSTRGRRILMCGSTITA